MRPITEYDPQTCVTFGELRQMGFPFPADIPDKAWVPRRAVKSTRAEAKAHEKGHSVKVLITFVEPIRCGSKVYKVEGSKVIVEEME